MNNFITDTIQSISPWDSINSILSGIMIPIAAQYKERRSAVATGTISQKRLEKTRITEGVGIPLQCNHLQSVMQQQSSISSLAVLNITQRAVLCLMKPTAIQLGSLNKLYNDEIL
jgi:hypothetical protein